LTRSSARKPVSSPSYHIETEAGLGSKAVHYHYGHTFPGNPRFARSTPPLAGRMVRRAYMRSCAPKARPAPDLVDRNFIAERPDQLWVAEITYIPTMVLSASRQVARRHARPVASPIKVCNASQHQSAFRQNDDL
jgi:hypothetical protein